MVIVKYFFDSNKVYLVTLYIDSRVKGLCERTHTWPLPEASDYGL